MLVHIPFLYHYSQLSCGQLVVPVVLLMEETRSYLNFCDWNQYLVAAKSAEKWPQNEQQTTRRRKRKEERVEGEGATSRVGTSR